MNPVMPFGPGQLVKLTAAATAGSYTFPDPLEGGAQIMVYNASTTIPVVCSVGGTAAVPNTDPATAGTGAFVVPPSTMKAFTVGQQTALSFIRDGASDATIYVMYGFGN
jgi:hypothetical protein